MSRSNNTEIINPAKYLFEWVGSKGCLKYYDKNLGDKGQQVMVPLPFNFLVLDRLSRISGFSDPDQSGFWSNEIRNTKTEKLTVRTKKGIVDHGLYSELTCLAKGACYAQSVYIAYVKDAEIILANLQLSGSAIGPWIELCKGRDIYKYGVTIDAANEKKKGTTTYFEPVFKLSQNISPETETKAIELDKILQEYLTAYFKRSNAGQVQENNSDIAPEDVMTDKQKAEVKNLNPKEFGLSQDQKEAPGKFKPAIIIGDDYKDDLPF